MNLKVYLKEICKNCSRVLKDIPDRLFFKKNFKEEYRVCSMF